MDITALTCPLGSLVLAKRARPRGNLVVGQTCRRSACIRSKISHSRAEECNQRQRTKEWILRRRVCGVEPVRIPSSVLNYLLGSLSRSKNSGYAWLSLPVESTKMLGVCNESTMLS